MSCPYNILFIPLTVLLLPLRVLLTLFANKFKCPTTVVFDELIIWLELPYILVNDIFDNILKVPLIID